MEAKDTVINRGKMVEGGHVESLLEAQAEISFKAGIEEAFSRYKESPEYILKLMSTKLEGIREVVEWIKRNDFYNGTDPAGICIENPLWQAKLKKWGL